MIIAFPDYQVNILDYNRVVKTSLKSILKDYDNNFPIINNLVLECNEIVIRTYQFIRLDIIINIFIHIHYTHMTSKLAPSDLQISSNISHNYLQLTPELPPNYLRIASKLPPTYLQSISEGCRRERCLPL